MRTPHGLASHQAHESIRAATAKEPRLTEQTATILGAWFDLSTERAIGMAVGPIPWNRIVKWCEFSELDREASRLVIHVIRQIDNDRAAAEAAQREVKNAKGERHA